MPTAQEILEKNKRTSKALSSSSTVPYGTSFDLMGPVPMKNPVESEPMVFRGPNTTDEIKSSSTAPDVVTQPAVELTPPPTQRAQNKRVNSTVQKEESKPTIPANNVVPYTAPKKMSADYERVDPQAMNWDSVPFGEQLMETPVEKHRSVLQAIMGWRDIPYGQKWHHYLQHGVMAPGARSANEIRQNAALEANPTDAMSRTFGQELRAKEQKRRTLTSEWDKLLADWNKGVYASGDEATVRAFYEEAERLRNAMAQEGINPYTLRKPSINAGGFAQGFQKSIAQDREKLDWLGGWLDSIQQNIVQNPNWINSNAAQMEFDKLSEYVILNWAQSKGAIADAEKVRAQVEAMPREDRVVFDRFMNMFFNANTMAQVNAMADAGDRDAMATMNSFYKFMDMAQRGEKIGVMDKYGNVDLTPAADQTLTGALFGFKNLFRNQDNNPIDINPAITSYKNAKDAFLEYTMQNANVDRQAIWDMANDQFNIYKKNYQRKLPQLGLFSGWDYRGPAPDPQLGEWLSNWQRGRKPSDVMANATVGIGHMPTPQNTAPKGKGGRGGLAQQNDNYIYRGGKKYIKQKGKYVEVK